MKFRFILLLTGMVFSVLTAHGQYVEDALRYSQSSVFGSARFQGMGGVNTALGADVSSIAGNPAGLGFFQKSEWSLSPSLLFANTKSDYLGTSTKDSKVNFNIANMGIVFASPKSGVTGGAWRGGSFGIGFTRLNNFQNQFTYQGVNNRTSVTNFLVEQTDDLNITEAELDVNNIGIDVPNDLRNEGLTNQVALAQLAYQGFLIDPLDDDGDGRPDPENYYISGVGDVFRINQREQVKTTGGHYQWNFSYGGNIADKFYFGASLGIPRIRYSSEKALTETVLESDFDRIDNFTLTDFVNTSGTGVNGTLGFIYRPNDVIRFGASATTPTYYWMREEAHTTLYTRIRNTQQSGGVPSISLETQPSDFTYNLTTPFKASGGIALFLGKSGFVSGDVEYVAYNSAKLSSELANFNADNDDIQTNYQPTINFRVGGEFRQNIFRARGGFAYFGDPYDQTFDNLDRTRLAFSGGIGVRLPSFYIDLGVVHSRYKSGYTPYPLKNQSFEPSATIQNAFTNAVVSFGTFF